MYAPTAEMQAHMLVWGTGERSCLGMNMAIMEVKLMVARVLTEFRVKVENDQTHKDMLMCDHMVTAPRGGKGMCIFEPLKV